MGLGDELAFAGNYVALMKRRFGDAIDVQISSVPANGSLIPPISIQVLLENAVKHNAFSEADPLHVHVSVTPDAVSVQNARRPLEIARPSSRIGLRNLNERFELLTRRSIEIVEDDAVFCVTLPLIHSAPT